MARRKGLTAQERLDREVRAIHQGEAGSMAACREVLDTAPPVTAESLAAAVHRKLHEWERLKGDGTRQLLGILTAGYCLSLALPAGKSELEGEGG